MDKAGVIAIRDLYKNMPTKIICDNMEIFYDNIQGKSNHAINLIWDDDNEVFYSYRANSEMNINSNDGKVSFPVELMATTYENIQYIALYLDPASAIDFVNSKVTDVTEKVRAKTIISSMQPVNSGALDMSNPKNGFH